LAAQLGQDPSLLERLDEPNDALIGDPRPQPLNSGRGRDLIEARLDVCF
jgi:hypothetical protein